MPQPSSNYSKYWNILWSFVVWLIPALWDLPAAFPQRGFCPVSAFAQDPRYSMSGVHTLFSSIKQKLNVSDPIPASKLEHVQPAFSCHSLLLPLYLHTYISFQFKPVFQLIQHEFLCGILMWLGIFSCSGCSHPDLSFSGLELQCRSPDSGP